MQQFKYLEVMVKNVKKVKRGELRKMVPNMEHVGNL